ncbi:hypothetical protein [Pleionea sp. CnH1-48]|nr:hypothetical protein [Pleionea sp. CnH1-48]
MATSFAKSCEGRKTPWVAALAFARLGFYGLSMFANSEVIF